MWIIIYDPLIDITECVLVFCFLYALLSCIFVKQVGLPLVQQYLFQFEKLVKEQLPRLGAHFDQEMINPSMYASQWFITVFSYSFPFPLALRIWDVFLHEVCYQISCFCFISFSLTTLQERYNCITYQCG